MFPEVLEAAAVLDEIDDVGRVEAWASSVLGVWAEDPDARSLDRELVDWLLDSDDPRALPVLAAVGALVDLPDPAARALADARPAAPWAAHLGTARPTRAWRVDEERATSFGIGFVSSDASEHSLLADLDRGVLTALVVAPGPDDLFDGAEDLIDPVPLPPSEAAAAIVDGWLALLADPVDVPESLYVNGAIGRARLRGVLGEPLAALDAVPLGDEGDPMSHGGAANDAERAEENRWALHILAGAIGTADGDDGTDGSSDPSVVAAVLDTVEPGRIAAQPRNEREAYRALEWADWLGVVITAVRHGAGTLVDPRWCVDAINRCPEVTSAIPKRDRAYYEWAFGLVLAAWRRGGVIDAAGALTESGVRALPAALSIAWAPTREPG